jgi:hypothetical protein
MGSECEYGNFSEHGVNVMMFVLFGIGKPTPFLQIDSDPSPPVFWSRILGIVTIESGVFTKMIGNIKASIVKGTILIIDEGDLL